jgi:zinc protease
VAREGVTEAELNRVKTQWVAGEVYKLDSVFNQARELGSYWVLGLPLDAGERLMARLRGVTPEQVQAVAAAVLWRRPAHRGHAAPAATLDPNRKRARRPAARH